MQRGEQATRTFTTIPRPCGSGKPKAIACACRGRGKNENAKFAKIELPHSFTKVRLGDDMKKEIYGDGTPRNMQLAAALIAGPPLGIQRMKHTTTRRGNRKHLNVMPTSTHVKRPCMHSKCKVAVASPINRILSEGQNIEGGS